MALIANGKEPVVSLWEVLCEMTGECKNFIKGIINPMLAGQTFANWSYRNNMFRNEDKIRYSSVVDAAVEMGIVTRNMVGNFSKKNGVRFVLYLLSEGSKIFCEIVRLIRERGIEGIVFFPLHDGIILYARESAALMLHELFHLASKSVTGKTMPAELSFL